MTDCCCCLDECIPPMIINTGITLCEKCMKGVNKQHCPITRCVIKFALPNHFVNGFYQYLSPPINMKEFLEMQDKIKYLERFERIIISNPDLLFKDGKLQISSHEFEVFANKCDNLNCRDKSGNQLLNYLYECKEMELIKLLIKLGATLNYAYGNGVSLLQSACYSGDMEWVKFFISQGAKVNIRTKCGTPLHTVCRKGDELLEIAEYLISEGAPLNTYNFRYVEYPIHIACRNGALKMVQLLVKSGASLNCTDKYGRYPIHRAIYSDSGIELDLVRFLVDSGSKIERTNNEGRTPSP